MSIDPRDKIDAMLAEFVNRSATTFADPTAPRTASMMAMIVINRVRSGFRPTHPRIAIGIPKKRGIKAVMLVVSVVFV